MKTLLSIDFTKDGENPEIDFIIPEDIEKKDLDYLCKLIEVISQPETFFLIIRDSLTKQAKEEKDDKNIQKLSKAFHKFNYESSEYFPAVSPTEVLGG